MKDKRNISGLSEHRLNRKKGVISTPFNDSLGDKLKLGSWAKERMPEYLWLGLILQHYGRKLGLEKAGHILFGISRSGISLLTPRLSMLFDLSTDDQKAVYEIILKHVDKDVLAPLTLLYKGRVYPIFNEYFFISDFLVEERISILSEAVKLYSPHQSNEATDLRFLALSLLLFNGRLKISTEAEGTAAALKEYAYTDHEDERMRWYRPTVRSTESAMQFDDYNTQFSSNFWKDFGMITPCNPIKIEFPENTNNYKEFTTDCWKILEYVFYSNKELSLTDDKFAVIVGSINYALKIFAEINDKELGNSILGRHGIRTMIEIYIMLKYLLGRETKQPEIWKKYKLYGISKYKLIVLKAREYDFSDITSHFFTPVAEALVNEFMNEEFIDVDLKYFDNQGIREKSIEAGEKRLYDLFYDYDSNFSHGLWGAVSESAMLHCSSANHQYHSIPDLYSNQNLPDVKLDSNKVMLLLCTLLAELYYIPAWFVDKYQIIK